MSADRSGSVSGPDGDPDWLRDALAGLRQASKRRLLSVARRGRRSISRRGRPAVARRTWAFLGTSVAATAVFAADYGAAADERVLLYGYDPPLHEWLFSVSLVAFACYAVVPAVVNRDLTRRRLRQLRRRPLGAAAFAYLAGVFVVGLVGPLFVAEPGAGFLPTYQPPVGVGIPATLVPDCAGRVVDGTCYGTWAHPLGTTGNGQSVLMWVVHGFRVALEVALVSGTLLVPLATLVGTAAATFGGRADTVLMRYVDLQQAVPAFFVYLVAQYVYGPSLTLMLVVFGLLSWGGIARMVRAEALAKREAGYVRAAASAGASRLAIARRHLVPNVATTVVTAVSLQIPLLVLVEAGLSYLAFGDPQSPSFGWFISSVTNPAEFPLYWWLSVVPTAALGLTVLALNVLGDVLRDVLDPRLDR